jgi:hypothetical protein
MLKVVALFLCIIPFLMLLLLIVSPSFLEGSGVEFFLGFLVATLFGAPTLALILLSINHFIKGGSGSKNSFLWMGILGGVAGIGLIFYVSHSLFGIF